MSELKPSRSGRAVHQTGRGRSARLRFGSLDEIPGLAHAFTLRDAAPEMILQELMPAKTPLRILRQVHGATVRVEGRHEAAEAVNGLPLEGDALVTDLPAVAIGVRIADCVPILACDPVRRAIAAVHAGWRGTVAGVLAATLETMARRFASRATDLVLAIGPAIGPCCFEVGEEVIESLLQSDPGARACIRPSGRRHLVDLIEVNRRQALAAGVPSARISSANLCTVCHPELFWSYRRESHKAGRMLAFIGWAG